MGDAARKLFEMAMALSDEERRELVEALVAAEPDAAWHDAWAEEIERRLTADPDARESIAWTEAVEEIRSDLKARRR